MNWIKVEDDLPPEDRWVLCHISGRPWSSSKDPSGVFYAVLQLTKGISEKERIALPDYSSRKGTVRFCDEHGNNRKPYAWSEWGPGTFCGNEISHWCEIDRDLP